MVASNFQPGDPFCSQCGFLLRGQEAAPRCPECQAPLPAALAKFDPKEARRARTGFRSDSPAKLLGWPLVSISLGADPETGRRRGVARGIIAIGDGAIGGVAIGGGAVGIVAVGGGAAGIVAIGGGAIGLLAGLGGGAIGGCAVGGLALGGLASGGGAVGYVAQGGAAAGVYARGGAVAGVRTVSPAGADPDAVRVFEALAPVMGASGPGGLPGATFAPLVLPPLATAGLLAAIIGAVVVLAQRRFEQSRCTREAMLEQIVGDAEDDPPARQAGESRASGNGGKR